MIVLTKSTKEQRFARYKRQYMRRTPWPKGLCHVSAFEMPMTPVFNAQLLRDLWSGFLGYAGSHRMGNKISFDRRWRHGRVRNLIARLSRRVNR